MTEELQSSDMAPFVELLGRLGVAPEDVPPSPTDAAAMAADVVISRDDRWSLRDVAREAGIDDFDGMRDALGHLGVRVDDPDAVLFNDADVELARFLDATMNSFLTEEEGINILHVADTALGAIAEAGVSGHVQGPEARTADYLENAELNVAMGEIGLELAHQLGTAFRHHLRQATNRQRRNQSLYHRELQELTIGFVDLVGFTSLSQVLDPVEIVALVRHFESHAHELAHRHHVRVVKLIGDEVMFVAEEPAAAAAYALGLIDAFARGDVVPRGGIAGGSLVTVHGDYFGAIVNLAARLVDEAVPGEILVDSTVADDVTTEPAGRRMLKGFAEPVAVHTLLSGAPT